MQPIEKIIERLGKLRAMGLSPYPHEAATANNLANKLEADHKYRIEDYYDQLKNPKKEKAAKKAKKEKKAKEKAKDAKKTKSKKTESKQDGYRCLNVSFEDLFRIFYQQIFTHQQIYMEDWLDRIHDSIDDCADKAYGRNKIKFSDFYDLQMPLRADYQERADKAADHVADLKIHDWWGQIPAKIKLLKIKVTPKADYFEVEPYGRQGARSPYQIRMTIHDSKVDGVTYANYTLRVRDRWGQGYTYHEMLEDLSRRKA